MRHRPTHAGRLVAGTTLVLAGVGLVAAPPAQAATYQFWGYYSWDGSQWAFAQTGPAQTVPLDGSVQGWRLAVTAETSPARVPRAEGDFDQICGTEEAAQGQKRVAVVIDPGSAEDAPGDAPEGAQPPQPRGACAVVPEAATGADVLAAVEEVRVEGGLVCAIGGYPATGCGEEVEGPAPTAPDEPVTLALPDTTRTGAPTTPAGATVPPTEEDDGVPLLLPLGVVAVAAVGGAAVLVNRRNRGGGAAAA